MSDKLNVYKSYVFKILDMIIHTNTPCACNSASSFIADGTGYQCTRILFYNAYVIEQEFPTRFQEVKSRLKCKGFIGTEVEDAIRNHNIRDSFLQAHNTMGCHEFLRIINATPTKRKGGKHVRFLGINVNILLRLIQHRLGEIDAKDSTSWPYYPTR